MQSQNTTGDSKTAKVYCTQDYVLYNVLFKMLTKHLFLQDCLSFLNKQVGFNIRVSQG